ncbi:hyalin-like, partial [Anneissia japonica]|uniref:hyalin-like n=1 Tax=Anneissia japonica TaxID=1529436 RepID=UPI0014258FCC
MSTATVTYNASDVTVTDNSGETLVPTTTTSFPAQFVVGSNNITYTATDSSGNTGSCTFTVMVEDSEGPVLTCPPDTSLPTDERMSTAIITYNASDVTVTDNSGETLVSTTTTSFPAQFVIGPTNVTYTATDSSGNTGSCTFTVMVTDIEDPVVNACPKNFTLPTDEGAPDRVVYWINPTATDNSGNVSISYISHTNGSTFILGESTVTYNFSDPSENTATCEFIVTIIDVEPPTAVSCPSEAIYSTDPGENDRDDVDWVAPSFFDNAPSNMALVFNSNGIPPGSNTFQLGTTEVTYTATDQAMNTGYCTFYITIIDTERPIVMCPDDISTNSSEGAATALVNYTATATDNVEVTMESFKIPSGSLFYIGDTNVTFMAFDAA